MKTNTPFTRMTVMIVFAMIASLGFATSALHGQDKKVWQTGTIIEAKAHEAAAGESSQVKQYDVSFKVGKKVYVALYTLGNGRAEPQNYLGIERPVLIDGSTLKYNDLLGKTFSLPILKSRDVPREVPK